jgi:diaminopimelate epimerase
MNFSKFEGLANDFIVTSETLKNKNILSKIKNNAVFLCDRKKGIGGDGILCVLKSNIADFCMRIFNSDGSEAEMCGNGIRCFVLYLRKKGLLRKKECFIETKRGIIKTFFVSEKKIMVDMGAPILNAPDIPVDKASGEVIMEPIEIDSKKFFITAVSMGNPHAVIYVEEFSDDLVKNWGKKLESHPFFPNKANIEFVKVISDKEIFMRVYERGCGETMACGTGACASVVSGVLNKKHGTKVTVHLLGGDLNIEWDGNKSHSVYMTGPANYVFKGNIDI